GAELKQWRLTTSSFRLPAREPLAQFKTCNKLAQILSRAEADDAGSDEALLANTDGFLVEGSSSNLFWAKDDMILSPPLNGGILPGVTRAVVLELCRNLGLSAGESNATRETLTKAEGVFFSLSSAGIAEAISLDGQPLSQSGLSRRLSTAY